MSGHRPRGAPRSDPARTGGVVHVELNAFADVLAAHALCTHVGRHDDVAQPRRTVAHLVEVHGLEVGQALGGAVAEEYVRDEALSAPRVRVAPEERLMLRRREEVGEQVEDLASGHDSHLVHRLERKRKRKAAEAATGATAELGAAERGARDCLSKVRGRRGNCIPRAQGRRLEHQTRA